MALNSRVAIKFLHGAAAEKGSVRRRFTTEAQVTAQLKSPNAVQVFDFGFTEEGQPYLVMELLEGETLGRRLERVHRLTQYETVRILGQCSRALQRAHQLGIVHRDFKPDNIVICVDPDGVEQVKVLDFGLAKLIGALETESTDGEPPHEAPNPNASMSSFTRTGAVLGTPLYMAPEQVRDAGDVDLRADIWAFGVVAFECLTGQPPFKAPTIGELFERIRDARHPRVEFLVDGVKPGFEGWFEAACAPDRERRYPSAVIAFRQLAAALEVATSDDSNPRSLTEADGARVLVIGSGSSGNVQGSENRDELGSMQRIALRSTERPPPIHSPDPLAASRSHHGEPKESRRNLFLGTAAVALVLVVVGVWRASSSRSTAAPQPEPSAPVAPVDATPSPPSLSASPPLQAPSDTAPAPPAASASQPTKPRRAPPTPSAQRSATTTSPPPQSPPAQTVVSAPVQGPSIAPSAAPVATGATDPGSYR
jgi:serine/threonine-protein kinase